MTKHRADLAQIPALWTSLLGRKASPGLHCVPLHAAEAVCLMLHVLHKMAWSQQQCREMQQEEVVQVLLLIGRLHTMQLYPAAVPCSTDAHLAV